MLITAVERQKKNPDRCSIFIDGEFAFGILYVDALYFKLKEGEELAEEKYEYIMENLVYIKAQNAAINFLGYKARTEKEVFEKLREKEFSDTTIERVLEFLTKYGYIDDHEYCRKYIKETQRFRPKGIYAIKMELQQRGVAGDTIHEVMSETEYDEVAAAKKLLSKKYYGFSEMDRKEAAKASGYLGRKGFGWDVIKTAFRELIEEEKDEDETQ